MPGTRSRKAFATRARGEGCIDERHAVPGGAPHRSASILGPKFRRPSAAAHRPERPRAITDPLNDSADPDLPLLELARAGDERAFEALVVKYQRRVARLVSRYFRAAAEIEDVTQDVFIRVFHGLAGFKAEAKFSTWLFRITVNTCLTRVGREKRSPLVALEPSGDEPDWNGQPEPATDEGPERQLLAKQIAQTVQAALDTLNPDGREALLLYEEDGLSYQEIADRTGVPIGTVRARIFRAREAIAARLETILGASRDRRW